MKKILVHLRTFTKFISLVAIAAIIITAIVVIGYKPMYSVSVGGEFIRIYSVIKESFKIELTTI